MFWFKELYHCGPVFEVLKCTHIYIERYIYTVKLTVLVYGSLLNAHESGEKVV